MKPRCISLFPSAAFLLALSVSQSQGDDASWTTATSGDWSTGPWSAAYPNGSAQIATFNQNWSGQIINVDTPITVGQILATDTTAGGGLTISGGTLTLDNGGSSPIISTGTNNAFGESAANRFKISSVLDGTNGFERQGNGYLDLSGVTNLFTGTIKLTAAASGGGSFTVINNDANLGNAANVITVALSSQPVGFYNDAAAGSFTLNSSRTITTSGSGAFWVKNKAGANMTIAGVISGTAQLRKNDSGTLTLTGANTFTGGTLLDGGTLVLSGGDNRLASDRAITFNSVSTLDLTNTSQTVTGLGLLSAGQTNTVTGAGGTLIHNATGDYTVNTTVTGTSLNMAGLSNYTFNRTAGSFQLNANGANVVNTINLAKAGTNTINVTNARFGGGANAAGQNVLVGLGQNNNINASGEFVIGYFQGNGDVFFQSGLTSPTLTVRGAGGVGATPLMSVGSTNSGNQPSTGILNLTGGSLDVIATDLYVARHFATDTSTASTGTLTMPAGTVVATTLNLAAKTNTTGTIGAPTLTGTFNQSGGTVIATTVNLGNNAGSTVPNLIANYNLSGGTLFAAGIAGSGATYGASTVRNLNLSGGTLRNLSGSDLSVDGLATTATGRINVNVSAASTIHSDVGRTITLGGNTRLDGSGALSKSGDGTLVINGASSTYTGTLGVNDGTLAGQTTLGGAIALGGGGTIAPGNSIGTIGAASLVWEGGGLMSFELSNVDDTSDLLSLTGAFSKGAAGVWAFNFNGTGLLGETYTLVTFGSSDFDVEDFSYSNLGGGYTGDFALSGSDLTFTVIPEPGAALLGGIGTLLLLRRRRGA